MTEESSNEMRTIGLNEVFTKFQANSHCNAILFHSQDVHNANITLFHFKNQTLLPALLRFKLKQCNLRYIKIIEDSRLRSHSESSRSLNGSSIEENMNEENRISHWARRFFFSSFFTYRKVHGHMHTFLITQRMYDCYYFKSVLTPHDLLLQFESWIL